LDFLGYGIIWHFSSIQRIKCFVAIGQHRDWVARIERLLCKGNSNSTTDLKDIGMNNMIKKPIITFEKSAKEVILSFFDKIVDDEGFIVEKDDPTQRVLTPDGEEVSLEEFAGIRKGSEIFIKSNLPSMIELADQL